MRLFFKECKAISKSVIYLAFVVIVVLFFLTQFDTSTTEEIGQAMSGKYTPSIVTRIGAFINNKDHVDEATSIMKIEENPIAGPNPEWPETGYKNTVIPEQVMPQATALLATEYLLNGYRSYPFGFYKVTKLSPDKQKKIAHIMRKVSGLGPEEVLDRIAEQNLERPLPGINMRGAFGAQGDYSKVVPILVDYTAFLQEMEKVRKLIGWGSCYSENNLDYFGMEPLSYENRLADYDEVMVDDRLTNAYARYFCDYLGIVAALFAVFVPVSFLLRDRRAKMSELLYVRGVSSLKIIGARFFASAIMCFLPVLVISFYPLVQLAVFGAQEGIPVDYFAFIKYACAWVLPTILTVTGVAFLLTILTETPIAILVQMIWSIGAVFTNELDGLAGDTGFALVIRHNLVGGLSDVREQLGAITVNRVTYSVLALALLACSVVLFEQKRKGQLYVRGKRSQARAAGEKTVSA